MTTITFVPCALTDSGYAGFSHVQPLFRGLVASAIADRTVSFEQLFAAEAAAKEFFRQHGGLPCYFPRIKRVEVDVHTLTAVAVS